MKKRTLAITGLCGFAFLVAAAMSASQLDEQLSVRAVSDVPIIIKPNFSSDSKPEVK